VNAKPPRWVSRLLEGVLPPTPRAQAILGDLQEEFAERSAAGVWRARTWYVWTSLGICLRYAGQSRNYARKREGLVTDKLGRWEGFVDSLVMNSRYAVRRLSRSPMFTFVAVASLGLGIGANTAMFSLVNAVIIRDLPYEDPESLIDVYEAQEGFSHGTLSYPDYEDLRLASADVFTGVAGSQLILLQADSDAGVEVLPAEAVTGNYFSLLGVKPALGRLFTDQDHIARGAHPVVVLGHGYWERRFASDRDVVGTEVRLAGRPYTVIGVAPREYTGNLRGIVPEAYVPIMMFDELQGDTSSVLAARGNQSLFVKARLAPGATFVQAETVAARVGEEIRSLNPRYWQSDKAFVLVPTSDVIMNPMLDRFIVPAAGMMMVVVGLVLLIACANLASFLLARAADRRKEIAVRLALGAKRRTLIVQLLTETLLLSLLGGVAGVIVADQSLRALVAADLPLPLPITLDLSLDATVLGFSILLSVGAGVLFGLVPALQSTNPDVAPTLRDESAGGGRSKSVALRNMLVVGQVAVSMVLLLSAGLFLRSLNASRSIDPGFGMNPTGLLVLNVAETRFSEEEGQLYIEALRARIAGLPGVEAVGLIDNLLLNTLSTQTLDVLVDGVAPPAGTDFHSLDYGRIDEGFLEAAEIPLLAGRGFDASDVAGGAPVVVVNETFERDFFPEGGAVGRSIRIRDVETRIVGVARDTKVRRIGEAATPYIYRSHRQAYSSFVTFAARTRGDAGALALEMMVSARALDPEIMVVETKTMARHLAVMLLARQLGAFVVAGFAMLALLLATIGLYGVVSYAVSRRAREVGIRISLGAEPSSVVRMLTMGGLKLVAVGGAIGMIVAAAASRLLSTLLYGVPPLDAVTFLGVPILFGLVALAASWIPARRVTRINPVGALRAE